MSALLSVSVCIKDPKKFKEYISKAPATMEPFGAKKIGRGKVQDVLQGEVTHNLVALFEFPSKEAIEQWYHSESYQRLIALRDEAAAMNIAILDSF